MLAVDMARPPLAPLGLEVGESERLTRSSFMLSCVEGNGFRDRVVGEFRNFWRRLQMQIGG